MRLHSRGAYPPRLESPPLSDGAWELIRTCWVREASKRPRIDVVRERMAVLSQSVVSTLAPAARHLDSESHKDSAQMSSTTTGPARPGDAGRHIVLASAARDPSYEAARGLKSCAALPVRRSSSIHHLSPHVDRPPA
jgi:hypothetical protein